MGFIGWFGPRGLASIIFGLLAVEELTPEGARPVLPVIACTVLLSVLAHGLTSAPLANRYGAKAKDLAPTGAPPQDLPVRGMAAGGLHHWRRGGGPSAS